MARRDDNRHSAHSLEAEAELREIRRLLREACRKHPPLKSVELAEDWPKWLDTQLLEAQKRQMEAAQRDGPGAVTAWPWVELDTLREDINEHLVIAGYMPRNIRPEDRQRAQQSRARDVARTFHLRVQRVANETGDMGLRVLAGWFAYWAQP